MERWQAAVQRDAATLPSAQELPKPRLWDHLPDLLEEVSHAIGGSPTPAVEAEARQHATLRVSDGYNISEVLRELSLLREALMDVVEEYARGTPGLTPQEAETARRQLHRVIDHSAQVGADQYHTEALSVRRLLWSELEGAYLELKTASEQKDRFLAMLGHELRNPLSPILTAVQLLEFSESDDPRLRRAREIIERQVRHQARLIDDLLDVTRIATGKLVLRREPQNLSAAIQYAVDDCLPAITAKGQTIHVEQLEEPLPVDADPVRLGQVFTNLLVNAHKYTEAGGSLRLIATQEGSEVVVRVRDTGIGISAVMLPRVFDLFTQAAGAGGQGQSGLGIGLALVKHLVELHGGTVQAHSDGPGRGAEFVVRLPLARSQAQTTLPGPGAAALPPRRRVAVVEDNPDARATLAELLELLGYQVFTAADGAEALRLAHLQSVEAFVVDIGLPDIDGCEVARALRRMPGGESRLLIALTGYGSADELAQMRAAGFDAHLIKPAEVSELERLLAM